jgi:hypothetical protein
MLIIMAPDMDVPQVFPLSYHPHRRGDARNPDYSYFEESRKCPASLSFLGGRSCEYSPLSLESAGSDDIVPAIPSWLGESRSSLDSLGA